MYTSLDWRPETILSQRVFAGILYLDVYMSSFLPQVSQQLSLADCSVRTWISNDAGLSAPLVSLLHTIVSLFYSADPARVARVHHAHKVDVDEVLTLVRDLEQWEQRLPAWAKWEACLQE